MNNLTITQRSNLGRINNLHVSGTGGITFYDNSNEITSVSATGDMSCNTLRLSNNILSYVPWTAIYQYSQSGTALLTNVCTAVTTAPTLGTSTSNRVSYYYSVVGKILYLNLNILTATSNGGGTAGSGTYLYMLPPGFTTSSKADFVIKSGQVPTLGGADNGTLIGTAVAYLPGTDDKTLSCYYAENGSPATPYVVLWQDIVNASGFNGSVRFPYSNNNLYIAFQAAIPLA